MELRAAMTRGLSLVKVPEGLGLVKVPEGWVWSRSQSV